MIAPPRHLASLLAILLLGRLTTSCVAPGTSALREHDIQGSWAMDGRSGRTIMCFLPNGEFQGFRARLDLPFEEPPERALHGRWQLEDGVLRLSSLQHERSEGPPGMEARASFDGPALALV